MTEYGNGNPKSTGEQALGSAADIVNAAVEHVDRVGQHLKDKIEAAKQPETYLDVLKSATRAAPICMLAAAFFGGMLFARRR